MEVMSRLELAELTIPSQYLRRKSRFCLLELTYVVRMFALLALTQLGLKPCVVVNGTNEHKSWLVKTTTGMCSKPADAAPAEGLVLFKACFQWDNLTFFDNERQMAIATTAIRWCSLEGSRTFSIVALLQPFSIVFVKGYGSLLKFTYQ
eukprot:763664-Hanusia_phi.AAC.11